MDLKMIEDQNLVFETMFENNRKIIEEVKELKKNK